MHAQEKGDSFDPNTETVIEVGDFSIVNVCPKIYNTYFLTNLCWIIISLNRTLQRMAMQIRLLKQETQQAQKQELEKPLNQWLSIQQTIHFLHRWRISKWRRLTLLKNIHILNSYIINVYIMPMFLCRFRNDQYAGNWSSWNLIFRANHLLLNYYSRSYFKTNCIGQCLYYASIKMCNILLLYSVLWNNACLCLDNLRHIYL